MGPSRCRAADRGAARPFGAMAEWRGFDRPSRFYPTNRLAGGCLRPLGHHSKHGLAEGVGFEPTELALSGFQDRRLRPLGHPSARPPGGDDYSQPPAGAQHAPPAPRVRDAGWAETEPAPDARRRAKLPVARP